MSAQAAFAVADCDVACRDVWQLDLVRKTALLAYKRLEQRREIKVQYPVRAGRKALTIAYDAAQPHDWILATLKAEEARLVAEYTAERDTLAKDMDAMVDTMTEFQLPIFEQMAERYGWLNEILKG